MSLLSRIVSDFPRFFLFAIAFIFLTFLNSLNFTRYKNQLGSFSSILPIRRIFLTRLFVYLSRINNFLLVNHHDVPLETQFSSLSLTVNLLEGALDNFFLSRRKEEKRKIATTTTRTKKKDAKMRKREPATWLQPIRVDVKADRRSQRRIYNQHDCLTPHNQRPYPYHASQHRGFSVRFTSPPPAPTLFSS